MTLTPEEQAALERLQKGDYDSYGDAAMRKQNTDLWIAACIALRDHPADDTCDLSRQELIEEVKAARERIETLEEFVWEKTK